MFGVDSLVSELLVLELDDGGGVGVAWLSGEYADGLCFALCDCGGCADGCAYCVDPPVLSGTLTDVESAIEELEGDELDDITSAGELVSV